MAALLYNQDYGQKGSHDSDVSFGRDGQFDALCANVRCGNGSRHKNDVVGMEELVAQRVKSRRLTILGEIAQERARRNIDWK